METAEQRPAGADGPEYQVAARGLPRRPPDAYFGAREYEAARHAHGVTGIPSSGPLEVQDFAGMSERVGRVMSLPANATDTDLQKAQRA